MRVYFLAEKSCALRVNGIHLGLVDGFERSTRIQPSDDVFCELLPADGFLPVRFTFNEAFLLDPPPQIRLYYTENAVAVYACGFLRADQTMRVLWQKRFADSLLTLMSQGKIQLNLQNETGFHLIELPDDFQTCSVKPRAEGFLLETENAFSIIKRDGTILLRSEGRVLEAQETLKAEIPFHDSAGHSAVCEWKNGELISCAIRSAREPTAATFALALFESALIGADVLPFLSPALAEKADSLKEYLGDYRSVVLTAESDKVGLVYTRKERVFDVRYFRIETENGKISNIKPID